MKELARLELACAAAFFGLGGDVAGAPLVVRVLFAIGGAWAVMAATA